MLILTNIAIIFMRWYLFTIVIKRTNAFSSTACSDCAEGIRQLMESSSESIKSNKKPPGTDKHSVDGEQWTTLPMFLGGTISLRDKAFIIGFFERICKSYGGVEQCLRRCADRDKNAANFLSAYKGLNFICKERKTEFFKALPCLSEQEANAWERCSSEIAQSQETTVLFTNSIVNREFHSIQMLFSSLCRDIGEMMRCMEPIIRTRCGTTSVTLLLQFVGLEFSSFEKLYFQLGFDLPLPLNCRVLSQQSFQSNNSLSTSKYVGNGKSKQRFSESNSKNYRIGNQQRQTGNNPWAKLSSADAAGEIDQRKTDLGAFFENFRSNGSNNYKGLIIHLLIRLLIVLLFMIIL